MKSNTSPKKGKKKKRSSVFRIKRLLRLKNKSKIKRMKKKYGFTQDELKDHIQIIPEYKTIPWKDLTIEHKFPWKSFADYNLEKQIKLVNCLENLTVLSFKDNVAKGCQYDLEEFEKWLKSKGVAFKSKLKKKRKPRKDNKNENNISDHM